jgi:hypothetical protein
MNLRLRDNPTLSRIRRNHGLEHATIHVLSARHPQRPLIGRSDPGGFYLYGDLPSEAVAEAAGEALRRLRAGEHRLSLHPNCGTNLLTAGVLGAAAALASLAGASTLRRRLGRFPAAVMATVLGLVVAQPLGMALQRTVTTQGDPEGLKIEAVKTWRRGRTPLHRVVTSG